jgi:hypothetical protein
MKNMNNVYKKLGLYFLAGAFILFTPLSLLADGMVITPLDPYSNRWDFSAESSQRAFINYEKGREKMLMVVRRAPRFDLALA